ncbi:MAG: hypothetical protein ABSE82_13215 [Nitrososphaerales archaeon]
MLAFGILAILPLNTVHAQTTQYNSIISFQSYEASGPQIFGYYVALMQNGQVINSCYTTCEFVIQNGVQYQVQIDNGNECFAYWNGPNGAEGNTSNTFDIDISGASTSVIFHAYYTSCNGGSGSGTSQLTIKTQNMSGSPITGYYAVLNQSGRAMATGLTPTSFTLNNGQTYTVQVDNYGSCNFAYWADTGSTSFYRTLSISSNTSYTAVINCGASTTSTSSTTSSVSSSSTTSSSSTQSSSSVTTTSSTSTSPLSSSITTSNTSTTSTNPSTSSRTTSSSASVTTSSTKSNSSAATSSISQKTLATTSTQASGTITLHIAIVVVAVVIVIVTLAGLFMRRGKSNPS